VKVLFPFIKDGGDGNAIANMMSKTLFAITKVKSRGEGERESNSTEIVEKPEMCAARENCPRNLPGTETRTRRRTMTKITFGLTSHSPAAFSFSFRHCQARAAALEFPPIHGGI
jgi:hypothetical protein